jgi:hypothetical protein
MMNFNDDEQTRILAYARGKGRNAKIWFKSRNTGTRVVATVLLIVGVIFCFH